VPEGVQRLPSGRYPQNFTYAGKVYDGPQWTPELAERYPNGVRFTADGFPDFAPYATATVAIEPHFVGNYTSDITTATELAGLTRVPDGYTWHHHQDTRTMQLVPVDLHEAVRHAGGTSIMKGRQ
jgi:filamentous hemagglutinin